MIEESARHSESGDKLTKFFANPSILTESKEFKEF